MGETFKVVIKRQVNESDMNEMKSNWIVKDAINLAIKGNGNLNIPMVPIELL